MPSIAEARIRRILFIGVFITYAWFFQGGGWNQNARYDQVWRLVEDGTFDINEYFEDPTRRNTNDFSFYQGRYYPNKPPGVSLLGLPAYTVLVFIEGMSGLDPYSSWKLFHVNAHLVCAFSVSLLSACLVASLFTTLNYLRPSPAGWRVVVVLAYGLGTMALPWSTLFQAHQPSAALTFLMFAVLLYQEYGVQCSDSQKEPKRPPSDLDLLAGFLGGIALMVAYNNAPVIALVMGYRLVGPRPIRGLCTMAIGMVLPVAFLLLYHWVCFGHPLATSYTYENEQFVTADGKVFDFPTLKAVWGITFSEWRGLFYGSPVLVFCVPGFVYFCKQRCGRLPEALVCIGTVVFYFVLNTSFINWHGGWCSGPRYMIPSLPFMVCALHFLSGRLRLAMIGLAGVSVCIQFALTAVDPSTPHQVTNPTKYSFQQLFQNKVSINNQGVLEMFPPEHEGQGTPQPRHAWSSFNVGELIGLSGVMSLLPLLVVWTIAGSSLWLVGRWRSHG
ncbi:MAG: hypothetical protein O3B01_10200 [Planctomycetota bacterium]|nr:hypothetical protein [Planctomycetota bacterium]